MPVCLREHVAQHDAVGLLVGAEVIRAGTREYFLQPRDVSPAQIGHQNSRIFVLVVDQLVLKFHHGGVRLAQFPISQQQSYAILVQVVLQG